MRLLFKSKDGGKDSNVTGYWLFESKSFGSVVLLRFDKGSREAFHTHAFNAISWIISGYILEVTQDGLEYVHITPTLKPLYTARDRFHRVFGVSEKTWVFSIRGPWSKTWKEYLPDEGRYVTLSNGRVEV